jgi:hypothetical protein
MSGFGQFSQEAYDQLREAYSNQLSQAEDVETAGVKIGSDTLGLETAPYKADWLDKTGLWKYPDGKGDYMDAKQSQEDLLAALRSGNEDEIDEDMDLSDLSDEELLALAAQMVEEEDEEEEGEIGDLTDEELDALLDEILAASEDDEESEDEEESDDEEEESVEEEDGDDAISVAEKIAALKEELASLSANLTLEGDEEEAEAEDEEEEPTEAVEETDSEEDPIEEEEEVNSDDEP